MRCYFDESGRTFRSFSLGMKPLPQTHSVPALPNETDSLLDDRQQTKD